MCAGVNHAEYFGIAALLQIVYILYSYFCNAFYIRNVIIWNACVRVLLHMQLLYDVSRQCGSALEFGTELEFLSLGTTYNKQ